jgi:hypothetical protein
MEKAPNAARLARAFLIFAIVALLAAGAAGALVRRHSSGPPAPVRTPATVTVPPTTLLYGARPGPNGTKLLTETIDPLTLAVPGGWVTAATDQLTLPSEIDNLAAQAPPLAALLKIERQAAVKSAIRVFAYQPTAPPSYISVVSLSSPGVAPLTAASASALVALANKQKTPNAVASGAQLPVGQVVKTDSTLVVQKQRVAVEDLIVITAGRTILVEMVTETSTATTPPLFAQIAQSLSLS